MTFEISRGKAKRMFTWKTANLVFGAGLAAFALNAAALMAADTSGKHLEVLIETDGVSFKVLSRKEVDRPASLPARQVLRDGFLFIEGTDTSSSTVYAQSLPDPTQVYYDYSPDGSIVTEPSGASRPLKGGIHKLAKAKFVLSLPVDVRLKGLKISRQKKQKGITRKKARAAEPRYQYRANQPLDLPEDFTLESPVFLDLAKAQEVP